MEVYSLFLLFAAFQLKHFICDYLLQAPFYSYMKGKFYATGWFKPLLVHSSVHGAYTLVITLVATHDLIISVALSLLDITFHTVMDRLKASPNLWGRFSIEDPRYWISLGFDQMFHHFTHYLIIFFIWIKMTS